MNNNKENYKKAISQIHPSEKLKNETFEKIIQEKRPKKIGFMKYIAACAAFAICLSVGAFYFNSNAPEESKKTETIAQVEDDGLNRFENIEQLKEMLKENQETMKNDYTLMTDTIESTTTASADSTTQEEGNSRQENADYSTTNTQVENVDEADIVKTDGEYIYYVTLEKVYIINAKDLKEVSNIDTSIDGSYEFHPQEIYINGDKLVILGNSYMYEVDQDSVVEDGIYYDIGETYHSQKAKALIYDISDKSNPKQKREVALDGYYNNSRMIGNNLYFISTKSIYYYDEMKDDDLLPVLKDTAVSEEEKTVVCTDIAYFPESSNYSYMMVAGFNIDENNQASIETFFGASDEIYASEKNLYITDSQYNYYYSNEEGKTEIYKFNLDDSKIKLQAKTEIKGYVNNQFSMDEYDGNLRIATTNGYDDDSENQLFILDENLNEIGKIEKMAEGERIYSVRFIGKVGYIVTFEQIDPLFVIDLSDPTNPTIKGELKIPGYSSYLHPYDETHIIGIGYNTKSNGYGGVTNSNMKMSMFDVSDLENPKEIFSVDIGEKYTYSEITSNHKALFYNEDKNLIGFPITTYGNNYSSSKNVFNIYEIDLEKGFVEYGSLEQDAEWKTNIKRAIYIGDTLYTFAEYQIVSYDLDGLNKLETLDLE